MATIDEWRKKVRRCFNCSEHLTLETTNWYCTGEHHLSLCETCWRHQAQHGKLPRHRSNPRGSLSARERPSRANQPDLPIDIPKPREIL